MVSAWFLQVVMEQGGLQPGGLNFDAKVRRESTDVVDLFISHIGLSVRTDPIYFLCGCLNGDHDYLGLLYGVESIFRPGAPGGQTLWRCCCKT